MEDPTKVIRDARQQLDPAQRAKALGAILGEGLPALTAELKQDRQAAVLELRASGKSWQEVGDAIGLHRNRAQQIGEGRSGGKPKVEGHKGEA